MNFGWDIWQVLNCLMSIIAFFGTVINAERNKLGFVYFSVRFFYIGEYSQGVLFAFYFLWAIRGIYVWTKKENKDEKAES